MRTRFRLLLIAALVAPATLATASAVGAATTATVAWDGSLGGWVGQGVEGTFRDSDADAAVAVSGHSQLVRFEVTGTGGRRLNRATVELAPPSGSLLVAGTYEDAQRVVFREAGHPGLSVTKESSGCNTESGRFVVHEATYGSGGDVETFAATVEHRCDGGPPLFVDLRYDSARPFASHHGGPRSIGLITDDWMATAERTFTLRSQGETALVVGTAALSGVDADNFAVAADGCSGTTVAVGASCDITVEYEPDGGDDDTAVLTLPDNSARGQRQWTLEGGNDLNPSLPQLPPDGAAPATTAVVVDRTDQDATTREEVFLSEDPAVDIFFEGSIDSATFTLVNNDSDRRPRSMHVYFAAARGDWLNVGDYLGAERWPFHEGPHPGLSVSADGFGCNESHGGFTIHEFVVGTDGKVERFAASWMHSCGLWGPKEAGEVRINSTVPFAARRVTPARVDFGGSDGTPASREVTVTSTGNAPLELDGAMVLSGEEAFAVVDDGCEAAVLAPGQSCVVTLEYVPATEGTDPGLLYLPDNTANYGRLTPLAGYYSPPPPPPPPPDDDWFEPESESAGYWMLGSTGTVHAFGDAEGMGGPGSVGPVNIASNTWGDGYWVVNRGGTVWAYGEAPSLGGNPALRTGEAITSISGTPSGEGYWLFSNLGRVFPYGDARHFGDMGHVRLNGPVLGSVSTPSGNGYYMVASDGGVFAFGDARFHGSMGSHRLNGPVVGLAPDPDGVGYWLVASDGGVFSFQASFRGSMGGKPLNKPMVGMVAYGDGYLMVASDGGIFNFSSKPFVGSLGGNPPPYPIVAVAPLND